MPDYKSVVGTDFSMKLNVLREAFETGREEHIATTIAQREQDRESTREDVVHADGHRVKASVLRALVEQLPGPLAEQIREAVIECATPSVFERGQEEALEVVEGVLKDFSFQGWIDLQDPMTLHGGLGLKHLLGYWHEVCRRCANEGYSGPTGRLEQIKKYQDEGSWELWEMSGPLKVGVGKKEGEFNGLEFDRYHFFADVIGAHGRPADPKALLESVVGERAVDVYENEVFLRALELRSVRSALEEDAYGGDVFPHEVVKRTMIELGIGEARI